MLGPPYAPKESKRRFRNFRGGDRWTPLAAHRISPHAQVLAGGRRISHEIDDIAKHAQYDADWLAGKLSQRPLRSAWSVEHQSTGPAIVVGVGVDYVFTRSFAWRVVDAEYTHSWVSATDQINATQGLKIASEVVLRIGTW